MKDMHGFEHGSDRDAIIARAGGRRMRIIVTGDNDRSGGSGAGDIHKNVRNQTGSLYLDCQAQSPDLSDDVLAYTRLRVRPGCVRLVSDHFQVGHCPFRRKDRGWCIRRDGASGDKRQGADNDQEQDPKAKYNPAEQNIIFHVHVLLW